MEKLLTYNVPNLFIPGFPKCGTTSLYECLNAHSDIKMSYEKEPAFFDKGRFFDKEYKMLPEPWTKYLDQFRDDDTEHRAKFFGDATPCAVFPEVARRVAKTCGRDVKFIICLRDPVVRAYSNFWHGYRLGLESDDIVTALIDEAPYSVKENDSFPKYYLLNGRYWIHIERFVNQFGIENIHFVKFENLIKEQHSELKKIWNFLEIDPMNVAYQKANPAKLPRFTSLQRFIAGEGRLKNTLKMVMPQYLRSRLANKVLALNLKNIKYPAMHESLREWLGSYYYDDNIILRDKFGINIDGWTATNKEVF